MLESEILRDIFGTILISIINSQNAIGVNYCATNQVDKALIHHEIANICH
jgi:hypothetical protein